MAISGETFRPDICSKDYSTLTKTVTYVNSLSTAAARRWHFKVDTTVGDTFYNFLCLYLSFSLSVDGLSGTLGKQNFDPVDLTNEPRTTTDRRVGCAQPFKTAKREGVTPQQGFPA